MATVYIGNAVADERGKAKGGNAGNQTGAELRIQPWYANKKGWRVFRPRDAETAKRIADDMYMACKNPCIGYDQDQRGTLYSVAAAVGFDCGKVEIPCECDCSALVRVCLAYAGIKVSSFHTGTEPKVLLATGQFTELTDPMYTDKADYLVAGDILVTRTKGHTAVVVTDGSLAPAVPAPEEKSVKVIGRSVNVRNADGTKGRIMFTAHRGDTFPLIGTAPSGWYEVVTSRGNGFITNLSKYTRLI